VKTTRGSPDGTRGKASPQWTAPPPGPPCAVSRSSDAVLPEATAVALQAASFLLDYPADSETDLALIAEALDELPKGEVGDRLGRFVAWWGGLTPRDREVAYVNTFELGAGACLHLTSKRSRDKHHRGQELIRLRDIYREHGWEPCSSELPDYLPMVLEFAAAAPGGMDVLAGEREALLELRDSLEASASPFADVLAAILAAMRDRDHTPERGGPR
jgi:nitrate reductase delta subunit